MEQEDVDLVAMSTHGRSGLSELLFGSVAEAVVAGVSVPVLLVHPTQSEDNA
ncbi:MAG: universal stress protein [Candidatus Promineifilaceae bacterium]